MGDQFPRFELEFVSADVTITSAGLVTLAHGLNQTPKLIQWYIRNTTTEFNYSVGDISYLANMNAAAEQSLAITPDATNISIRFTSDANVFQIPNKTTGVQSNLTNANWVLVVLAWS